MNIVVLVGGFSNERNVSFSSGCMTARALRQNGHQVAVVDLLLGEEDDCTLEKLYEREIPEEWAVSASKSVDLKRVADEAKTNALIGPNVIRLCQQADLVFLALHGGCGEDGRIQACLDCLGIKYTGADYLSSGIAMNKDITKLFAREFGIKTPDWNSMIPLSDEEIEKTVAANSVYPIVVKIPDSGSSVGVYVVHDEEEYRAALKENIGRKVIIEQYIKGREIQMGFLEDKALPSIEIVPLSGFYNYENKYVKGKAIEVSPADIAPELETEMAHMLMTVARATNVTDYARADFIIDDQGQVWFIEINTLPGMTATSLLPQEAEAAGISFNELCERLVNLALLKKVGIEKELG